MWNTGAAILLIESDAYRFPRASHVVNPTRLLTIMWIDPSTLQWGAVTVELDVKGTGETIVEVEDSSVGAVAEGQLLGAGCMFRWMVLPRICKSDEVSKMMK